MNQTLSSWWPHLLQAEENKEGDCGESPLLPLLQRHFAVADDDHGDGDDKYDDGVGDGVDDNANETNDDDISISNEQNDDNMSIISEQSDASLASTVPWEDYVQEYLEGLLEDIEE